MKPGTKESNLQRKPKAVLQISSKKETTMQRSQSFLSQESGILNRLTTTVVFYLLLIFISAFISLIYAQKVMQTSRTLNVHPNNTPKHSKRLVIPLNCSAENVTNTCPTNYPTTFKTYDLNSSSLPTCPDYFRWIHEDLRIWKQSGISKEMVERGNSTAHFRLIILKGKAYVERYKTSFQTRDVFTLWGILQLLRRYPGRLPDLDLMFNCGDRTVIRTSDYQGPNAAVPPPSFHYCGDDSSFDIVFPDWSFWGWPELNIKPWEALLKDFREGNEKLKWIKREPYAYWKGNPYVSDNRVDLLKCNTTDWKAHIYAQDWHREAEQGFKTSNLAKQCTHRYKIYIEGWAWSVSEKYILACDSVTLLVNPIYYDFFTRGLQPLLHYWPIRNDDKCRSIKFAVDWSNNHKQKAQAIGKAGGNFIQKKLKMEYVYNYMFHVLNEYSKLLTYKPSIPENAVELCSETMACDLKGKDKEYMMDSMEKGPSVWSPCAMPPPFDHPSLQNFVRRKEDSIKKVEVWKKKYWERQNKH